MTPPDHEVSPEGVVERLDELRKVAEAAAAMWLTERGDTLIRGAHEVGLSLALVNAEPGSPTDRGARANAAHIATFDPPTVLALIERVKVLEEALEPFANVAKHLTSSVYGPSWGFNDAVIEHEDFRRALSALSNATGGEG